MPQRRKNTNLRHNVTTSRGEHKSIGEYRGKVLLIADTASKCGFTNQYEELEALNQEFKDKGLCVLGFPSDNFAHQEPDDDETIEQNCKLNFGVTFELFKKRRRARRERYRAV